MMGYATGNGMMPEDVAKLEASKEDAASFEHGLQGRQDADAAARGLSSSGQTAQNALVRGGQAVQNNYRGAIDTAASASDRALRALMGAGQYATGLSQNDVGMKSRAAQAQDEINKYNSGQKYDAQKYNSRAGGEDWNNLNKWAEIRGAAERQRAGDYDKESERKAESGKNIGAGIGGIANAAAGVYDWWNDPNRKKDQ